MNIIDIIEACVEADYGTSVSHQFNSSYTDGDFDECNANALRYIERTVANLLKADCFTEEALAEIEDYHSELKIYLNMEL